MEARGLIRTVSPAFGAIGFVFLWWLVAQLKLIDPVLLPSPQDSAQAIWTGFVKGNLMADLQVTIVRTLLAFLIATLICVPLGLVLGLSM